VTWSRSISGRDDVTQRKLILKARFQNGLKLEMGLGDTESQLTPHTILIDASTKFGTLRAKAEQTVPRVSYPFDFELGVLFKVTTTRE
jgi:hypothetical protein